MQKSYFRNSALALLALVSLSFAPGFALADTTGINFESYTLGTINSQDGWSSTGAFDHAVDSSLSTVGFGTQSLRISDAVTSGSFGDQTFAKPLTDSVGETSATAGTFSVGTKQTHFETQFDIASTMPQAEQSGLHMSVSPDRGDGSRMSYLRFEDQSDGIHVFFDDVTVTPPTLGTGANFNETDIATITRTPHTIKLTLDVVDGPSNDVVKVYIDGVLKATGTSWEDYYRFDPESAAEQSPRIVKTVLFRTSGGANPANQGKGFLIDNFSTMSGPTIVACNETASASLVSDATVQVDGHDAFAVTPHPAWTTIPGSSWIYNAAFDVNGSSATGDKVFTKTFTIIGTPHDSMLQIAADNMYTVTVNGIPLATGTSGTDLDNFSSAHSWVIPAANLVSGSNTVTITVTNPAVNPTDQVPFGDPNPAGLLFKLTVNNDECTIPVAPTSSVVHIYKFLDGQQASIVSANGVSFPMFTSTYNAPFTLGPSGWTTGDIAYEASTGAMPLGSDYSANEDTSTNLVGTTCDGIHPYALVGYTTGNTFAGAQAGIPSLTVPSFTNIQGEKDIIVWNKTCEVVPPIKVHILKYLDGVVATASTASNYLFPMSATWNATNIGGGTGSYVLGTNFGGAVDMYGADTAPMSVPADYTTSEITDATSSVVASADQCSVGKYVLKGYKTSAISFADAATQTLTVSAPAFTGLTHDQYIIVLNEKCPTVTTGTISGMKYNDLNRNGKKEANEPGLAGWVIKLKSGNTVITATTDASGNYTFANVAPGTYTVRETHKNGWKRMSKNPKPIVITAGSVVTGVSFGNAQKHKEEKEDTSQDDNRDEQSGVYISHNDKSNYESDQGKKDHEGNR